MARLLPADRVGITVRPRRLDGRDVHGTYTRVDVSLSSIEVPTFLMQGQIKERWQALCEQAATEQNPERLMELIEEINRLLAAKEERLNRQRAESVHAA